MKKYLLIFLMMTISPFAISDEVSDVISALGISKEQFRYFWSSTCSPKFRMNVPVYVLNNEKSIVKPGIKFGFIKSKNINEQELMIERGPTCEALIRYYFEGSVSEDVIRQFVQKDLEFKSTYGFLVIDAWGIEIYESACMNGKIDEFRLKHWMELEKKELISIEIKDSIFNGAPSKVYCSNITKKGEALNEALHRTSR